MPSTRCKPFSLSFYPNGPDDESGPYRKQVIPPNSKDPVDIENDHFKGKAQLIHDTGNEPGSDESAQQDVDPANRRGVELYIQGFFKHEVTVGEQTAGLWAGGELKEPLKLGWIMNNVVQLCAKYARKKTDGRFYFKLGDKKELPALGFPLGTIFTIIVTPAGETPPTLGGPEIQATKWQGNGPVEIDTTKCYTLVYRTPYLDLCSWELLKVPGVSPLALENILGDIQSSSVNVYDLGKAGSHANFKNHCILEFFFSRGSPGDAWVEDDEEPVGQSRPLEEGSDSDPSSDEQSVEARSEDEATVVEASGDDSDSSDDSSLDEDEQEEAALSRADSEALIEIEGWRPRKFSCLSVMDASVRTPYYIEAIDRRRRRKICIWYVFAMKGAEEDGGTGEYWHAKAATDLSAMCRPRRHLRTFRRGPGARRYTTYAVRTLEQFRSIVIEHLNGETKLKNNVLDASGYVEEEDQDKDEGPRVENREPHTPATDDEFDRTMTSNSQSRRAKLAAPAKKMAGKVHGKLRRNRGPRVPPRFFIRGNSTTCGLAFAHAREGRAHVYREALVGAVHFEGRLCEELMRVSSDGIIRCFTPYDCDKPRVRLTGKEVLHVEKIETLFLGRFHPFQVHTILRVFLFCTSSSEERDEWIQVLRQCRDPEGLKKDPEPEAEPEALEKSQMSTQKGRRSAMKEGGLKVVQRGQKAAGAVGAAVSARAPAVLSLAPAVGPDSALAALKEPMSNIADFLVDTTRARRWRQKKRLVLNDRVLLSESITPPSPNVVEDMLAAVLSMSEKPKKEDIIAFTTSTCALKAVRFKGWSTNEQLAFWINAYHCLLLHGCLVLGTPSGKKELLRFHNRVSYLIGLRPFSLKEIERIVLQLPNSNQQVMRPKARARARQFLGCCGLFKKADAQKPSSRSGDGTLSSPPRSPAEGRKNKGSDRESPSFEKKNSAEDRREREAGMLSPKSPGSSSSHSSSHAHGSGKKAFKKTACMPKMPLPQAPWKHPDTNACLFVGLPPEGLEPKRQDLRVALVLNRGNLISLPSIPVLDAPRLNSQLNDVAQSYVTNFVQVEKRDGRPIRLTFPASLQGIKRELKEDQHAFLKFIATFMPLERQVSSGGVQVKFARLQDGPRRRADFIRMNYSDANLNVSARPQALGNEFEIINSTAQALAKLQGQESPAPIGSTDMPDEELEWPESLPPASQAGTLSANVFSPLSLQRWSL